jgi:hypothetical protein
VQLGYVSRQLGHADVAVTARHYAKWVEGDGYREPMTLQPGEVPADLLARVVEGVEDAAAPNKSPQLSPHLPETGSEALGRENEIPNADAEIAAGGAYRARTCDLRGVSTALYQLS